MIQFDLQTTQQNCLCCMAYVWVSVVIKTKTEIVNQSILNALKCVRLNKLHGRHYHYSSYASTSRLLNVQPEEKETFLTINACNK